MTFLPTRRAGLSFLTNRTAQRRVALGSAAFALLGLLYGLLAPKWYQSSVTLVPVKGQRGGGLAALLGGDMAALAAGFEASTGGSADSNRIAAVLQGTAVTDAVIAKLDLQARYATKYPESAREAVWEHCNVRTLPKPNIVVLACEDKDPRFVQEMLQHFVEYGNQVFRRVNVSSASEEVRHLEKRILELRQQADDAAQRVREFQERHLIVDLDSQAKALVASIADLTQQRIAKEMALQYSRTFTSEDEARTRQLRSQLSVVEEKLLDLEEPREAGQEVPAAGHNGARKGQGILPAALAIPKLRAEFERLYRERKVAEATLLFAMDRLEGARAAEARDISTFVLLDPPTLPTRKSRPKRVLVVLIAGLLGLVASVPYAYWRFSRETSLEEGQSRPAA